ncbi:MAG: hypothetical protein IT379_41430 [Deltaproteobacteria bacterium]|nr:hypothetical protein [Deltaproteobacteria bacterium]
MKSGEYRDLVASYIEKNFGPTDLVVYTEVNLGKTIIGKDRKLDLFVLRRSDQRSLAIECKYQQVAGTTDEKIPYALQDLEAMWVPGCLVYAGDGWSQGVLHTLEGSRLAVHCLPEKPALERTKATRELDHVLAAVFGLWDLVLAEDRLFSKAWQLALPLKGPKKAAPPGTSTAAAAVGDDE